MRAVLQGSGPALIPEHLPAHLLSQTSPAQSLEEYVEERLRAGSTTLHAEAVIFMERVLLARVLKHAGGNPSQAAKILNITRGTLRSRIRQLGITIQRAVQVDAVEPAAARSAAPDAAAPAAVAS